MAPLQRKYPAHNSPPEPCTAMAYFPKFSTDLLVPEKFTCNLNLGIQFGDIISSSVISIYNVKKIYKKEHELSKH